MRNIIVLILAIFAGLILSEIIIRGVLTIKYNGKHPIFGVRISPYPGLAYDLEKCSNCTYRINSLGLRGDEVSIKKPEKTLRILILGDSATFGAPVIKDEETVPGRLNQLLSERFSPQGSKFEVINGGIPAYEIQEIYLHYKYKLSQLNSDIIIYNFFPNDFLNNRYTVEKINGKPTLVIYGGATMPGLQIVGFLPEKLNLLLNEYSMLYRYTLFNISQLSQRIRDVDFMDRYQLANVRYLDLLYEEIKKSGARFGISSEIYSCCSTCKEPVDESNCPVDEGCVDLLKTIKLVEYYCTKHNIPYVYLSDAVSDMRLEDTMADRVHYTGIANIKMGDRLYKFIIDEFLSGKEDASNLINGGER